MARFHPNQRYAAALILAALCALAAAQALAPQKDGRSLAFRFRRASQTTSAKGSDNAEFIKKLRELDITARVPKKNSLLQLQNLCYSAYQPGSEPTNPLEYGKRYRDEFDKVKSALSDVYDIKAWDHASTTLGKVVEYVTAYVDEKVNMECPKGFVHKPKQCTLFDGNVNKKDKPSYKVEQVFNCKLWTPDFALSHWGKATCKQETSMTKTCACAVVTYASFMKFEPKNTPSICSRNKSARFSLSLKEKDINRPEALFGIIKLLLLDNDVKARLKYAKIETMKARPDSILLQLCYDPDPQKKDIDEVKKLATTLTSRLSAFSARLSDDGPAFQEKIGDFFVADYSHGSSWGKDICCLWAGLADTDQLILALKLYQSPIYGYEMAGTDYPQLVDTRVEGDRCKLHFNYKELALTVSSTKADFKRMQKN